MPRVENMGENVTEWCEKTGDGSSTFNLCTDCHDVLEDDPHAFDKKLKPYGDGEPEGDEGRGGDASHPSYDEDDYTCDVCGCKLTSDDD